MYVWLNYFSCKFFIKKDLLHFLQYCLFINFASALQVCLLILKLYINLNGYRWDVSSKKLIPEQLSLFFENFELINYYEINLFARSKISLQFSLTNVFEKRKWNKINQQSKGTKVVLVIDSVMTINFSIIHGWKFCTFLLEFKLEFLS